MKHTTNIYNDLEACKHPEISKQINIMRLNSTKDNVRTFENTKINLYYELQIKIKDELDSRYYKYNTLSEVLTANYFVAQLVKKEDYTTIEDYRIFTTITNGKNKVIYEDCTDNIHYWQDTQEYKIKERERQLEEDLQDLELYKEFIRQHKAEEAFKMFKQQKENKVFWYEYKFRGFSPGCQPKGHIDVNHNKGKFGIIAYDRQLTDQELTNYELKLYNN